MLYDPRVLLLKSIALLLFLVGVLVGGLWILLEAAGAVAEGGDVIWYVAFGVTLVPALLLAWIAFRARGTAFVVLTVAAVALFAGVIVTYPSGSSSACPSGTADATGGGVTVSSEDLGGALVDNGLSDTNAGPTTCN